MLRTIIVGCNGKMGKHLDEIITLDEDCTIVAGVDVNDLGWYPYPIFDSLAQCDVEADVVIDFSVAKITDRVVDACVEKKLPLVLCTTGLSPEQLAHVQEASKEIPILKSANMSLGINTLAAVLQQVSPLFAQAGFDIEIVEKHHNQKIDAPSGTALMLADSINESLDGAYHYVYDRSTTREKRNNKEIGIAAVRGGTIVGEHSVIFVGQDEVLEFTHEAFSKAVFAKGAVSAAKFLANQAPGMYNMADVVK